MVTLQSYNGKYYTQSRLSEIAEEVTGIGNEQENRLIMYIRVQLEVCVWEVCIPGRRRIEVVWPTVVVCVWWCECDMEWVVWVTVDVHDRELCGAMGK